MADLTPTYRIKAGALLLLLLAGYAVLSLLVQSIETYKDLPDKDPVTRHEERIAKLKGALPAAGEVGYVTTVENEKIFAYERAFQNVEFLAQYVRRRSIPWRRSSSATARSCPWSSATFSTAPRPPDSSRNTAWSR